MPEVLIDLRGLQGAGRAEQDGVISLLRDGRAALPGAVFVGLTDPDLPPLPDQARGCVHRVRSNAYTGALEQPACFVQLAPGPHDPLFPARLLLHPGIPSIRLDPAAEPESMSPIARYWRARFDQAVSAPALWGAVAALAPLAPRKGPRLAVLTLAPEAPICVALQAAGAELFGPLSRFPVLAPRYDRLLYVLANTARDAGLIRMLRRHGGAALVTDSCLLASYADDPARAARLAGSELGRELPREEWRQWRAGIARPGALLLGEVAESAEPLFVHSAALAAEIAGRYGREAIVIPAPAVKAGRPQRGTPPLVQAHASGLAAESCVWALELLRFWGTEIRLHLACEPGERAVLAVLASRLGVSGQLEFGPGPGAALRLFLAMRGQASLTSALQLAAGAGLRCIASRSVVEATEPPGWVHCVPDPPSPPLLAEAIATVLEHPDPTPDALDAYQRAHDPALAAARLRAAL